MAGRYASGIAIWAGSLRDSEENIVIPSYVEDALNRGMQVHIFPLCDRLSMFQSGNRAWQEKQKREAIQLFRRGVDGIFFNLPDIGVEAKQQFLMRKNRS
jgi:glycerophosphoryl diester phosphodiesterase